MSLYAKINSENIVTNIVACEDSQISTLSGVYIKVTDQTNYPHIDMAYNPEKNKFSQTKPPFDSWIENENLVWESPLGPKPTDGDYYWDEESLQWVKSTLVEE